MKQDYIKDKVENGGALPDAETNVSRAVAAVSKSREQLKVMKDKEQGIHDLLKMTEPSAHLG